MSTLPKPLAFFGASRLFGSGGITHASAMDQRRENSSSPSVLVTHLDPLENSVEDVLSRAGNLWGARPIVVVTDSRVRPILGTGIAIEHMPSISQVRKHRDCGNWEVYLNQRWRMIHTKWNPLYTIHIGKTYELYLGAIAEELSSEPGVGD